MHRPRSARVRRRDVALLGTGLALAVVAAVAPSAAAADPTAADPGPAASAAGSAASSRYSAYLFTYFTGEQYADGEQVHVALSQGNDPLHWREVNRGRPVLTSTLGQRGVRDPFIMRSPDGSRFFLLATDLKIYGNDDWEQAVRHGSRNLIIWESTDLVNWSKERSLRVSPPEAGNTWAPEATWDPASQRYVVFWASALYADPAHAGDSYQRILYATTKDFRTFTPARPYLDPGRDVIDTTMIRDAGKVYRFTKPDSNFVYEDVGNSVFDPHFRTVTSGIGEGTITRGEGPLVFRANGQRKWYLFLDEFGGRGYVPFETTDLASGKWTPSTNYQLPDRPRHGTVLPITQLESERTAATSPRVCTTTLRGRIRGSVTVTSGVTCLHDAHVVGAVTVSGGATLVIDGGSITGRLTASGAGVVSVSQARVDGTVTLTGTRQWARFTGSRVFGSIDLRRSAGTVAPDLSGTAVAGQLTCSGNVTAPVLTGTTVVGSRSGQCALP